MGVKNLITGGAGFIGSHLAELLLKKGEKVLVWDDLSTGSRGNLNACVGNPNFEYRFSDFTADPSFARELEACDVVFHLAAAVGVQLIVNDPVRTIVTNIHGSDLVLKHAARMGKPVLLTSTSEVYGKSDQVPFSEENDVVYGPTSRSRWSYAVSKAVDEFLLLAYHQSHGLPGVVVRLFNTVGPRQVPFYGMVLPQFINQALNGGPITVYGDGNQRRCFVHVMDVAPALAALIHCPEAKGQVVNIGSAEEISILQLAEKVRELVNPEIKIVFIPYDRAYKPGFEDMQRRVPDVSKANRLIGYQPSRKLDTIISDVLAFEQAKRG